VPGLITQGQLGHGLADGLTEGQQCRSLTQQCRSPDLTQPVEVLGYRGQVAAHWGWQLPAVTWGDRLLAVTLGDAAAVTHCDSQAAVTLRDAARRGP